MSDERVVVAAVDNSLAANPVLVAARALARMLGARVEGIHVVTDGEAPPTAAASAVGVPLRTAEGRVVDSLIQSADRSETAAVVIGARSSATSPHALGSTALAVVTSCRHPVMVVPPVGRIAPLFRRVLVPLEGTVSTSLAPRSLVELGQRGNVDVVALQVDDEADGVDVEDFLRRFCPWGIGVVSLEKRPGAKEDVIPPAIAELECDLVALGWAQELASGRAATVKATLEAGTVPVLLLPVRVSAPA